MNKTPARARRAINFGLRKAGLYMVGQIVTNMRSGLDPPLAASTLRTRKVRGGRGARASKPLIKTGDLRNSIDMVPGEGEVFVGVPRSSGSFRLAEIHELGKVIVMRMTPKMRAFLFGVLFKNSAPTGGGSGRGIIVVRIPPRPFIGPIFESAKHRQRAREIFEEATFSRMGLTT